MANSIAETIKKIEISGNQRISNESIIVLGDIQINKEFNDETLNSSLKKLYETFFF